MSNPNVNTANGARGVRVTEEEMKKDLAHAKKVLETSKKKSVSIPKQMQQFIGEIKLACINGACIRVPVDGNTYEIPEPYYPIIMESLKVIQASDVDVASREKANDPELKK